MSIVIGPKIPVMVSGASGDQYLAQGNAMLRMLQVLVQANVKSVVLNSPPGGSPANGDTYVVGPSAGGAWIGQAGNIAYWSTNNPAAPLGEWEFFVPAQGWVVGNQGDGFLYVYTGIQWAAVGVPGGSTGSLQGNAGNGTFGGVPGSTVDLINGNVYLAPISDPSAGATAFSVTAFSSGDWAQQWFFNGFSSHAGIAFDPTDGPELDFFGLGERTLNACHDYAINGAVSYYMSLDNSSPIGIGGNGVFVAYTSESFHTSISIHSGQGLYNDFSIIVWDGDTGVSRLESGKLGIGNGTSGDITGGLAMATLALSGTLVDGVSSVGVNGQILSSTGVGVAWINAGGTGVNPQSGANYNALLSDNNNIVTMSNSGASTFTVPTNLSVPFPVGAILTISQLGTGQVTLTPASGAVTILTPSSLTTRVQYSTVSLAQVAANVWLAAGDLS